VIWGETIMEESGWRLENNPAAWGSDQPLILILGVSKGRNQSRKILSYSHNEIPFRGERANLTKILIRLGVLKDSENINEKISIYEQDFALGSLIRCSIAMWDYSKGGYVQAGQIVKASATNPQAQKYVSNCANTFLNDLPDRLKLTIMLSNDDGYIDSCLAIMKSIYPDIMKLNMVSYGNNDHTWIHVIHPSGSSGRHIPDWLYKSHGKQAMKREAALEGIRISGVWSKMGY
jgi:hypothetical protein